MKTIRHIASLILFVALSSPLTAQERYNDMIERTADMPAYEQIFNLLNYQRTHPEDAPVYYRLGDVAYKLLPSKDALHNYDERAELLYKARLFYGNCLHFMGGKMPRGETFPTVTPSGKKVEYEDVDAYLRARLDTLKRWRQETDTLHDRFYRMVDSYESCRQMFIQFIQKYPSEKLAHLCLTKDDYNNMKILGEQTRRFEKAKQLFDEALKASPIPHYTPTFRTVEIATYRLDGVTSSDFLANDIPLWDYAGWNEAFMQSQTQIYHALMRNIVDEYTIIDTGINRFLLKQTVQMQLDRRLPYRIERYDYQSPMGTFIRLAQLTALTMEQAKDSLTADEQISDSELSLRITASLEARQRTEEVISLLREMQKRINPTTASKYAFFLRRTQLLTVERLTDKAKQIAAFQQMLAQQIDTQLQNYGKAYPKQFEAVDISDDQAASEAAEAAAK